MSSGIKSNALKELEKIENVLGRIIAKAEEAKEKIAELYDVEPE